MDLQDSYFDLLQDSRLTSPVKDLAPRKPPELMGFETFKKSIKPEDLDPENFKTPINQSNDKQAKAQKKG